MDQGPYTGGRVDFTRTQIKKQMASWNVLGRDAFFKKHGITRGARSTFVLYNGIEYDAKALIAAATGLKSRSFATNDARAALTAKGFTVVPPKATNEEDMTDEEAIWARCEDIPDSELKKVKLDAAGRRDVAAYSRQLTRRNAALSKAIGLIRPRARRRKGR
jgi:hypothetical protein